MQSTKQSIKNAMGSSYCHRKSTALAYPLVTKKMAALKMNTAPKWLFEARTLFDSVGILLG